MPTDPKAARYSVRPWLLRLVAGAALVAAALVVTSRAPWTAEAPVGSVRAVIVVGQPGTPVHARRFRDWAQRFRKLLIETQQQPAAAVTVLSGDANFKPPFAVTAATAQSVLGAVRNVAQATSPTDQFVLILLGHSSAADGEPKYVLPGRDLPVSVLTEALKTVRADNQVVLDLTSVSGAALPALAKPGRVVVAATSLNEDAESVFGEFLLRGIESTRADSAGGDGKVSLLEAFNWATWETGQWIRRLRQGPDDTWITTGRESVEIFRKLYDAPTGTPGARKLSPRSDASVADPEVPLATKADAGNTTGRRVLTEHATLDDTGEGLGMAAIVGSEYHPLGGGNGTRVGQRAARVVLGQAALLQGKGQTREGAKP